MKRMSKKLLAVILSISMFISLLTGCGKTLSVSNGTDVLVTEDGMFSYDDFINESGEIEIDTEKIVETVSDEIQYAISTNWEDYVGDIETFVYGLIINELGYKYDVFPASVELLNGFSVYGIAYTDYEECFTNEDESISYFAVGFIPGIGELSIPEEDFHAGLCVENLDYYDDTTQFVLKYQSEPFSEHCVVYNQYVTYGVNVNGQLYYETAEYERGNCNEELGSLYSFDESQYVYDVEIGEYVYISGQPLATQIDYALLEVEINKILETQDVNFATVDIETSVNFAQEAVTNYLLSLQVESFLGYGVKSLVETASALDPMECYRVTSEGLITIDLEYATEDEIARWLVGTACVITVAVGMVGSVVFIECPPLSAAAGAIAGTGIEVFMQVVISNQKVSDIEWSKVAIAACSGALSGFLGPYVMATTVGASAFLIDSAVDGLIGGIEQTIYAWMDGGNGDDMAKSFGYGFALGFGLSAGFKGVGFVVSKVASNVLTAISKAAEKIFPKLSKKVSNLSKEVYTLKQMADSTIFHSKYIAKKQAFKQIEKLTAEGSLELKKKSFDRLRKNDIIDTDGNSITKKNLKEIFDQAGDGEIIGYFKVNGEIINIKKQNGMVGIVFDESKYLTVELPNGIRNNGASSEKTKYREQNFIEAATKMQEVWSKNPELLPKSIKEALDVADIEIEHAVAGDILTIIQKRENGWVLHENIDMKTITLVPREVHDVVQGGISHMGGFGLAGYVKTHMGKDFFDRFVSAASSGAVIAQ